jgi:hypothetical protein
MGRDSREGGSLDRTEQPISPRFFICLVSGHLLLRSAGEMEFRAAATAVTRPESMVCPLTMSVCTELTTFTANGSRGLWNILVDQDVPIGAPRFHSEIALPHSEYTMNIFYIIGVIVVVLFVAGFFGLHT